MNKKILLLISGLIIILIILIVIQHKKNINIPGFVIETPQETKQISLLELQKIEMQKIQTASGKDYQGFHIQTLLEFGKIEETNWEKITFYASDGGKISFSYKEKDSLYLAFIKKNSREYYRIIVPDDKYKQNWLKYINKISLK